MGVREMVGITVRDQSEPGNKVPSGPPTRKIENRESGRLIHSINLFLQIWSLTGNYFGKRSVSSLAQCSTLTKEVLLRVVENAQSGNCPPSRDLLSRKALLCALNPVCRPE
jgi:hypothetical protein